MREDEICIHEALVLTLFSQEHSVPMFLINLYLLKMMSLLLT